VGGHHSGSPGAPRHRHSPHRRKRTGVVRAIDQVEAARNTKPSAGSTTCTRRDRGVLDGVTIPSPSGDEHVFPRDSARPPGLRRDGSPSWICFASGRIIGHAARRQRR
jgi:hypothetical protein